MPWAVVRGKYRRGVIELLEKVPAQEGENVLILLPERPHSAEAGAIVTWNKKHFEDRTTIEVLTPKEFLATHRPTGSTSPSTEIEQGGP